MCHVITQDDVRTRLYRAGCEVIELQEYYEVMERARAAAAEAAVKKYRSLTPILCKVRAAAAAHTASSFWPPT